MPLPLGIAERWPTGALCWGLSQELRARYAQSLLGGVWALFSRLR